MRLLSAALLVCALGAWWPAGAWLLSLALQDLVLLEGLAASWCATSWRGR